MMVLVIRPGGDYVVEDGDGDIVLSVDGIEDGDDVPGPVWDDGVNPASDDDAVEEVCRELAPAIQSQCYDDDDYEDDHDNHDHEDHDTDEEVSCKLTNANPVTM